MFTDPVADFLTRLRNASLAKKKVAVVPHSKFKEELANLLQKLGFIEKVRVSKTKNEAGKEIEVTLKYQEDGTPAISNIVRVSKPGLRVYAGKNQLPRVLGGLGVSIISTSSGVMTDKEARKKNFGGEVIAKVW
ncbi:MAG: 30S ribosomal protein S8 [Patescibacteria group bacterium]|nr:30S ribosomal protein S8 [Patescibacteria group bacterium]